MKLLRIPYCAISSVALLAGNAYASPGTESLVTVRLTEQFSVAGTVVRDEFGRPVFPTTPAFENEWTRYDFQGNPIQTNYEYQSRITTYRMSNREFMGFLVSSGVIPSIAGWSLKAIYNEESAEPTYYVTKPGSAPIYVGDYFAMDTYGSAEGVNATSTTRYNSSGQVISYVARDVSTTKTDALLTFSTQSGEGTEGSTMNLAGMWQSSLSLRPVRVGPSLEYRYLNGAGSIYSISGTIDDAIDDGSGGLDLYQSIVEGSWLFSSGFPINDLSVNFPEAEPINP
ncbi:hypothetical protein OJ996_11905 [Luteolibacter sp. GHJ8]|uniref:YD repeat-containing protein n=1 Tax=Luteolibacter rhizosphaerae TaxID=2989719 RepID=A0ABT3G363_9BACT|nr:hypothetical protein [Luteolibacter rhizosphaerae]MCW1914284.1 hypothetical protein [Luteolibacter rhizosphaerae]